jgi:hypothetical protein
MSASQFGTREPRDAAGEATGRRTRFKRSASSAQIHHLRRTIARIIDLFRPREVKCLAAFSNN